MRMTNPVDRLIWPVSDQLPYDRRRDLPRDLNRLDRRATWTRRLATGGARPRPRS
jgi:hypothetical protein